MAEYNQDDIREMVITHKSRNRSRLQELLEYIKLAGYKRIGIASCISTHKFAQKLSEIIKENGMEVFSMHCKETGLDGATLSEEMPGMACDPLSQAEYLNTQKTELNIDAGLCLGHGILFEKYSKAPVTTFIIKDPATKHKPIENLE